jgi:hypothetical protein
MGELGLALALPSSTLRGELGWQLWDLGRWQEAEELVGEELTRVHPVAGALHLRLLSGRLHMGRGRFDLAHEQGQTTARLVGHLVDPLLHGFLQHYLAELATLQGDYSTALSAVDKAPAAPCRLRGTRAHGSLVSYRPSSRRRCWRARHDRRVGPFVAAEIHATGERLLERAWLSLAQLGPSLPGTKAEGAGCEAEFARLDGRSDPKHGRLSRCRGMRSLGPMRRSTLAGGRQKLCLQPERQGLQPPCSGKPITGQSTWVNDRCATRSSASPGAHESIDLQLPSSKPTDTSIRHAGTEHGLTPREQRCFSTSWRVGPIDRSPAPFSSARRPPASTSRIS